MNSNRKQSSFFARALLAGAVSFGLFGSVFAQPGPGGGNRGGGARGNQQGLTTTPVRATYDPRTNVLILVGPTDTINDIQRQIVDPIEANDALNSQVFTYPLKNASALNVEAVAQLLFTGQGGQNRGVTASAQLGTGGNTNRGGGGTAGRGGGGGTGAAAGGGRGVVAAGGAGRGGAGGGVANFGGITANAQNSASGLLGQVSVVADPVTNSLLVTTSPKNWETVKRILDELDRSVPQVLIQVLIAEVTHDNSLDLGVDFSVLNTRASGFGQQGGTNFALPTFGTAGAGAIVALSESNFAATFQALAKNNKLDVLSRPYILASDNQLATIQVGQTVPYVASSQTTDQGNTINNILYWDIGILLDVIPHINPDGLVILDVAPEVSSLQGDSQVNIAPGVSASTFTRRAAQSRVAVPNGNTVVIGGLMQDQKVQRISKVPLIGDIPWVGELFKSRSETKSKTELLIFMTPHVAARPDMLKGMGVDQLNTTKLIPNSVSPGVFDAHIQGMEAGNREIPATTRPATLPSQPPPQGFGPGGNFQPGRGQGGGRRGQGGAPPGGQ